MTRQTGGFAWAATSTRSRSSSRAMARASGSGLMPICCPSCPTSRTSRARIRSLIRGSLLAGGVAIAESCSCRRCFLLCAEWAVLPGKRPEKQEGRAPEDADVRQHDESRALVAEFGRPGAPWVAGWGRAPLPDAVVTRRVRPCPDPPQPSRVEGDPLD